MTSTDTATTRDTAGGRRPPRAWAALAGVLAAAAGLGTAELLAGLSRGLESPVVSVGDGVIVLAPPAVKDVAIAVFGQNDKLALLVGIGVLLTVFAAAVGVGAARRTRIGVLGMAAFGVIGVVAAVTDSGGAYRFVPAAVGGLVAVVAILALVSALRGRPAATAPPPVARSLEPLARRSFLTAAVGVAGFAVVGAVGGRLLAQRLSIADARAALELPAPARRLHLPVPPGADLDVDGVVPYLTPNRTFYRIDTALSVPQIDPATHVVRVTGMVDDELEIPFRELLDRPLIEVPITIACVSNEVGGGLIGNATWLGVRLADVLDDAGVRRGADQIVGRSVDGFTTGMPVEAAYDRDAILAVGMNGEPLPPKHGFPVRMVTPGLYGYVSACKWLAEIELTTFEAFDAYWIPRGWAARAPIKTQSRIDVPGGGGQVAAGRTPVAGVAWAPTRGIRRVEVRVDDGPWREAELAPYASVDTWRQWKFDWDAVPGRHRLTVRATDGTGATQVAEASPPRPDGATGYHTITVEAV